jgi:hypothetical protein
VGLTTFALTATLSGGTASVRVRVGALCALVAVAVTWLVAHLILTRPRRKQPAAERSDVASPTSARPSRHLAAWTLSLVAIAAALGVAWRLGNLDQPHPMSWASAFLSAGAFVLASVAALTAALHHHTYIHHTTGTGHER